jgi:6-pyruvoyltetrahydropterin/6-carboxytetrahydropterin synthase
MKFELRQEFRLESARYLPNLAKTHPCASTHGHSFRVVLILQGQLNEQIGWVRDYHEIQLIWDKEIKTSLDHKLLNEVLGLSNPTSEFISKWIFEKLIGKLPELKQVVISETPTTECRYPVSSPN